MKISKSAAWAATGIIGAGIAGGLTYAAVSTPAGASSSLGAAADNVISAAQPAPGAGPAKGRLAGMGRRGLLARLEHGQLTLKTKQGDRTVDLQRGTVCARAARLGRTVFVANVEDDADFAPFLSFAHDTAFKSVLSSPLVSTKGQLIGVASAHFANRYAPTRVELHSLEEYCQSLADVVEAHLPEGDIGIAAEALHRELISATR